MEKLNWDIRILMSLHSPFIWFPILNANIEYTLYFEKIDLLWQLNGIGSCVWSVQICTPNSNCHSCHAFMCQVLYLMNNRHPGWLRWFWNVKGYYLQDIMKCLRILFWVIPLPFKAVLSFCVCISVCLYVHFSKITPKSVNLELLCWCLSEHCKNITAAFCCYTVRSSRDMYLLFKISPPIAAADVNCPVTTEAAFWTASLLLCKYPQAVSIKQETVWKTYLFESGMSSSVRVG